MKLGRTLSKYLVEFSVLFIAVFMGFVAENFRENISENKQESMLMKSLLSDLRADSTLLQTIIEENIRKMSALDSFISIRLLDFSQQSNLIVFYEVWKPTKMFIANRFEPTTVSLNQLESTGVLSTTKETISTMVASYNVILEVHRAGSDNYYKHAEETFRMLYEMTDYIALWNTPPEYPPLFSDRYTTIKFFNLSADLMWTIEGYIGVLNHVNTHITEMITLIESEYE